MSTLLAEIKEAGMTHGKCCQCGGDLIDMINYDNFQSEGIVIEGYKHNQLIYFTCATCKVETYLGDLEISLVEGGSIG